MIFIETEVFTKLLQDNLTDQDYAALQVALIANPHLGQVIRNSGGLRKLRWQSSFNAKGKRGGIRVIYYYADYYYADRKEQIFLLLVYTKGVKDDLNAGELKMLRQLSEYLDNG